MPAYTDPTTTEDFAELLYEIADEAGRGISVEDAKEAGWMVPAGESLLVRNDDGAEYLVTVRRVS